VRCYWEHPWGIHWEHRGTYRELEGNKGKMKKIILLTSPKLKRKKIKAL
jgi:hypothetical protein